MTTKGEKTVSATAMATHLGLSRTFIERLASEGVLPRQADGRFNENAARLAYLRHLRQAKRTSAAAEARAAFDQARARALQLANGKREKQLMEVADHLNVIDELVGLLRTSLASLPARLVPFDLGARRRAEIVVRDVLNEIADAAERNAGASEGADA